MDTHCPGIVQMDFARSHQWLLSGVAGFGVQSLDSGVWSLGFKFQGLRPRV